MQTICLNGTWDIIERPLSDGPEVVDSVWAEAPTLNGVVPGDVNDSLVSAGRMPEPLVGVNFREFAWVQTRSWWFRRRFVVPADWSGASRVELSADGLDVHGDLWLNGTFLGHHLSAFYPFERDVGSLLLPGEENILLVRLTTGRERVPEPCEFPLLDAVSTEASRGYPDRGFKKRIYLRKPAYTWGWDWNPPLATCGITGNVVLRRHGLSELGDVFLRTELSGEDALIHATVEMLHHTLTDSTWATISLVLADAAGHEFMVQSPDVFVASGVTVSTLTLRIPQARLWWPNGAGEQHLYTVRLTAEIDGQTITKVPFRYGLRTVELEVKPGRFFFKVNGQPIFIKGGNYVPSDALYGRITSARVTHLVEEAAEANFNILRIWGGGRFEMDAFYDACDRLGILVWQDFMSACAPLPAHEPWFLETFRAEADYQLRRLHNRSCMALWSGNNEVGACYHWAKDIFSTRDPGWHLYHELLPRLVHGLCPDVPYWPTSPYGGVDTVSAPDIGDDHHWVVMKPDTAFWSSPEYWDQPERPIFNSEYGYGGPCCLESTREYMGYEPTALEGEIAREHTNTFYDIPRVNFSIAEHYGNPEGLPLEKYILLGGLCQGLNLGYSMESLRANQQSMGAIFWMYNDAWGENGWTIIDYSLRRKIAYYGVKRSLAPQRLALRRGGEAFGGRKGEVLLLGLNESATPLKVSVRFGYLSYDGTVDNRRSIDVVLPPRSREILVSCPEPAARDLACGTVVAWPDKGSNLEPVAWRHARYRELGLPPASVTIETVRAVGDNLEVTVVADAFAHAVHFNVGGDVRLSDHYFDLLPGEKRTVVLYGEATRNASGLVATCINNAR